MSFCGSGEICIAYSYAVLRPAMHGCLTDATGVTEYKLGVKCQAACAYCGRRYGTTEPNCLGCGAGLPT